LEAAEDPDPEIGLPGGGADGGGHGAGGRASEVAQHYLRLAYRHGIDAGRYWYKRGLYLGRDLIALTAGLLALPLVLINKSFLPIAAGFLGLQVVVMAFAETVYKHKTALETLAVLPVQSLYVLCKLGGVARTWFGLLTGQERPIQHSKRLWKAMRSNPVHD